MAHEIFGQRFYGARDRKAWHGLGIVNNDEQTAAETLKLIGNYQIVLDPLIRSYDNEASGKFSILRPPTSDDPVVRQFGVVDADYEVLTPDVVAEMWDKHVGAPVETMAALKFGKVMLITAKLPGISIKGDEVERFMIVVSTMDGRTAFYGGESDVRTVCQNTLTRAQQRATSSFRIPHYAGAQDKMGEWLCNVYQGALMQTEVLTEAYTLLASTKTTVKNVKMIAGTLYQDPQKPDAHNPRVKRNFDELMTIYQRDLAWAESARENIVQLYDNKSTYGVTGALAGTAWAAWNAVTEFETYRRGTVESTALNLITGDRAANISKAYDLCMELVPARSK